MEVIYNLLAGEWRNRILLCRVDIEQPDEALEQAGRQFGHVASLSVEVGKQVTLTAFHGKLSLLLAWTDAEALNVNVEFFCRWVGVPLFKMGWPRSQDRYAFPSHSQMCGDFGNP